VNTGGSAVGAGAFVLIFVAFFALWLGTMAFWIVKLVEVIKIPDHQYRAAGTDKTTWLLIVVLAGLIGALIWQLAKRNDVVQAAGYMPLPPPGWYPDAAGSVRWWDGMRWTDHRQPPPP
jgi:hypothetical protein